MLLVLFLLCTCSVYSGTSISYATSNRSANVNETVDLQCVVENEKTVVLWQKLKKLDSVPVPIAANHTFFKAQDPANPKYVSSNDGNTFTLKINNVNAQDAGFYKCMFTPDNPDNEQVVSKEIFLTVRTPPSIIENTTSPVTAPVNGTTKLECYVSGTPSPKVIWTREDNGLLPTGSITYEGSVLRIDRVRKEYAGTYYCTARNEVKDVRKTYKLQVEFEPEIEVSRKRVGQALQHPAELECRVAAFPDPQIQWFKNNVPISSLEPNILSSKSAQPNAITISKLVITTVNRTQYGTYVCKAENSLGRVQEAIEFYETNEIQCFPPTCGSSFDYPDNKLMFSTMCMLILIFRW